MFLITRIWDAINDPIMGMIADRTNTRMGKFRPYILWLAIPFGVIGFIMFTTPGFGTTGNIIYAYVTYTLMMMIYTAINVPYSALMGVITPNSLERTELSSYRFVAAYVGLLIITSTTESLVEFFGKGDPQIGWQWTMGCFSLLAIILFFITYFTTKERVEPPKDQTTDFKKDGKDLFANMPWLLIAGATVFQLTYFVIRASTMPYFIKYYVLDHSINILGAHIELSFSYFLTSGAIATLIGAILTNWFALGPVSVLQWAMYTDTADYGEWKFGRRATGLVMAASLFALKLGVAIGGAITGWVLAYYGFVANQTQTSDSLTGILVLMGIFTAVIGVVGATLIIFYPLNNKMMINIENDLT
ncbi:MAG: MFS transporter, partial [Ignavibacteriaceae bacterium]